MVKRAESVQATRERIIDATLDLFVERWPPEITMRDVAERAGVALQTVVNQFGNRSGLMAAAVEAERDRPVGAQDRSRARPDDIRGAVHLLMQDYERNGDHIIATLALEESVPDVRAVLARGRTGHRRWVESTFPGALVGLVGTRRARRLALLITATDVYTWKLLRRDQGLSVSQAELAIRELIEAIYRDAQQSGR